MSTGSLAHTLAPPRHAEHLEGSFCVVCVHAPRFTTCALQPGTHSEEASRRRGQKRAHVSNERVLIQPCAALPAMFHLCCEVRMPHARP